MKVFHYPNEKQILGIYISKMYNPHKRKQQNEIVQENSKTTSYICNSIHQVTEKYHFVVFKGNIFLKSSKTCELYIIYGIINKYGS